ncbi:MAG TPA: aspartate--tRNA(Asn) ligase [Candidatus Saccharimonadales bacterium]|nr:aspartate--tRNA(Asn) ligase [Candidatus Saccharimonadales bacterium]
MKRLLARDLPTHIGKSVHLQGWLYKKRLLGGIMFVVLRDRGGLTQIVVTDEAEQAKLQGLLNGTVLAVSGTVVAEPRAAGGVELHDPTLTVMLPISEATPIEIDKPIDHKSENFDTLFDNRAYNLRNPNEQLIFKLRAQLNRYIREFLQEHDFTEIQTPKLLAGATEGGAEVFKTDYFGREATLAQSPQFYKQMLVGAFERVFEIGPAFRAEPSLTTRHMSEVTMLDMEMGFIESHDDVLKMTEDLVYTVLTRAYKEQADELATLKAPPLVLKKEFPRYTVAEVHELYSKATGENTRAEKDLLPAEERWICDYAKEKQDCEAVFVTDFPIEAMKFYHMVNPDNPETVLWADLLFRGLEIATCPQREHRYEKLVAQMKAAGLDPEHPGFRYYLQAFQAGLPPHGGFGFGIDRLVQKTIGLSSVKEATLFPRDMQRLTP